MQEPESIPSAKRRASFFTLGCKLNHAETSALASRFAREGFDVTEFGAASDVVVINSCTVTENADRECRKIVRQALRRSPNAYVIVVGCYAQLRPEEIASIRAQSPQKHSVKRPSTFRDCANAACTELTIHSKKG